MYDHNGESKLRQKLPTHASWDTGTKTDVVKTNDESNVKPNPITSSSKKQNYNTLLDKMKKSPWNQNQLNHACETTFRQHQT